MANVFRIGGASSFVNLKDTDKYESFKLLGAPVPTRERDISASGCGEAPGDTAQLNKSRVLYWTRSYLIYCTGADLGVAEANAKAIEDQIDEGRKFKLDKTKGHKVWMVRFMPDWGQVTPNVWTMLDGLVTPQFEERYGSNPATWVVKLDLDYMIGTEFVDNDGYPIDV